MGVMVFGKAELEIEDVNQGGSRHRGLAHAEQAIDQVWQWDIYIE
jgi:hypothetical protein